jgi:hypothetical protein
MSTHLSVNQKIQIIEEWILNEKSTVRTQRALQTKYGFRPDNHTIINITTNFTTYGSVLAPRPGGSRTVRTPETIFQVQNLMSEAEEQEESLSLRRASMQLNLPTSTVNLILKQDLNFHPYHPILIHYLSEDDPDRRMQFCETFMAIYQGDNEFIDKIIWSDESLFTVSGHVNRHNCVYWSFENPSVVLEEDKLGEKVMVWAGIWSNGRVGPFFIDGSVNSNTYIEMLETQFWPLVSDEVQQQQLWFQQDGAPAHYSNSVRQWLDNHFPNRWIGRRGEVE